MPVFAALISGFVFGWGLLISGMVQPAKVLAFLDILSIRDGRWDPSLAVVMAAALAVSSVGFWIARRRGRPMFAAESLWPSRKDIDAPLVTGAALFGVGWGLVGLCPGPALENLTSLSPKVAVFVIAMVAGMVLHDAWQKGRLKLPRANTAPSSVDG
jgi:uncharacterized membrane protein YedE/YeeE